MRIRNVFETTTLFVIAVLQIALFATGFTSF
jgi:hypothetical protein